MVKRISENHIMRANAEGNLNFQNRWEVLMLVINSAVYIRLPYLEDNNQLLNLTCNLPEHILYGKEEEDMWTSFCVFMLLLVCP